jgi:peptide/nickel transport system permease protein
MTVPPADPTNGVAEPLPSPFEVPAEPGGSHEIVGRSLAQIAWTRFTRDKAAVAGGIIVAVLIVIAALSKLIEAIFGLDPNLQHQDLLDPVLITPRGSFGGISWHHPLGVDPQYGRDMLSRLIEGSWVSLLVAFAATLLSVIIGSVMGLLAGYYGGRIDGFISRLMDIFLAFPLLLFALSISASLQGRAFGLTGLPLHLTVLVFVIGFFNWPYLGRIVRGQVLSLREREFVDAARSIGAKNRHILFKELMPNLYAPIIVYSTLLIPTNILFEAGLSFLGVGIAPPQASWGNMLSQAVNYYQADPMFMLLPGLAIFITVLSFNLLGDGLRDALDPRSTL